MSQIKLLKTIVATAGIYPTPKHRANAIANLQQKINRMDRKVKACTQLQIFVDKGYTEGKAEPIDYDVEVVFDEVHTNTPEGELSIFNFIRKFVPQLFK